MVRRIVKNLQNYCDGRWPRSHLRRPLLSVISAVMFSLAVLWGNLLCTDISQCLSTLQTHLQKKVKKKAFGECVSSNLRANWSLIPTLKSFVVIVQALFHVLATLKVKKGIWRTLTVYRKIGKESGAIIFYLLARDCKPFEGFVSEGRYNKNKIEGHCRRMKLSSAVFGTRTDRH